MEIPPKEIDAAAMEGLRAEVAKLQELTLQKNDLEEQLKEINQHINHLQFNYLPEMMQAIGVSAVTLAPDGNRPGLEAKAKPYYHANIAASWSNERRQSAFATLEAEGAGDLIKTIVTVPFVRGQHEEARAFHRQAEAAGFSPSLSESVHSQTLTAWVREQIEQHHHFPPLEDIGATVGQVVKLKEQNND